MSDWLDTLVAGRAPVTAADTDCILVSIVHTQGSCPRDAGTRMLVTTTACVGTIGGGHLEYRAMAIAREQLAIDDAVFHIERFALGARLGQCCGGVAHVSFQTIPATLPDWVSQLAVLRREAASAVLITPLSASGVASEDKLIVTATGTIGRWQDESLQSQAQAQARAMLADERKPSTNDLVRGSTPYLCERIDGGVMRIAVFGAGHVGRALVATLAALPCRITWIDNRRIEFPERVPANVTLLPSDYPDEEVPDLQQGTMVVVLTHSHALDQRICEIALKRDDLAWCGLIGSDTKRMLFERRLRGRGLGSQALSRLTCPIGVAGIEGKHPVEIAIAVAAEILQAWYARQSIDASSSQVSCR